jgi:hypothetical protein
MLLRMKWPSQTESPALMLFIAVLLVSIPSWSQTRKFQFEQFPVKVYQGPIHLPKGLHKDDEGDWRDELEKSVAPPEVTFAGKHYLAGHSCGASCRYYQLFDLRIGMDIPGVNRFTAAEDPPKTHDGHPYLTILYSRPDSRLLIAEYHLDFDDPAKTETCRKQYFLLEKGKLRPVSKTFPFCTGDMKRRQ